GRSTVAENLAVILLDAEAGLQQRAGFERRLFVQGQEPAALVKVGSRLDWIKGVQVEVINLLRKQRKADGQTVFGIDHIVEPGKRVEAFTLDIAGLIQIFQAGNTSPHKSVFETLKEKQLVLFYRSADCDPRRG